MPPLTQEKQEIRKKRIVAAICIALVVVVFALITYFVGGPILTVLRENPSDLRAHIASYGAGGWFIMVGIVILQVVVAFIPGEPVEVAAGVAFGAMGGTILCLVGSVLATALIFFVVKKYGMKVVYLFFSKEKVEEVSFLNNTQRLDLLVFILFLIPGTPKDIITYFAGVTKIKPVNFLLITTFARIPSVLSSTLFGSMMMKENFLAAAIIYGITIVISVLGILWYRKMRGQRKEADAPEKNSEE